MTDKKKHEAIDEDLIRGLASLLDEIKLSEIEIEQKGIRIRIARTLTVSAAAPLMHAAHQPAPAASGQAAAPVAPEKHPGTVTSPMVGTAYRAPEPGAPPFVEVGSIVKEGQTLLIVEAMKTMNQIPAPRAGKVTAILVENGQPVEYGEPLMIIE